MRAGARVRALHQRALRALPGPVPVPARAPKRAFVTDAKSLVPALPRPRDLQPFPAQLALRFLGHTGPVRGAPVRNSVCTRLHAPACCSAPGQGVRPVMGHAPALVSPYELHWTLVQRTIIQVPGLYLSLS